MPLYQSSFGMIHILWLLKEKKAPNYSFIKSFLKTYTTFTFLLKVQMALRKADQV